MTRLDQTFELRGPGALVFGRGTVTETGDRTSAFGDRALVVTDAGVREAGLLDPVGDSLAAAGVTVDVFDGVESDPTVGTATAAARAATEAGVDAVVGVGGGSSMDVAKAAALAAGTGRSVPDLLDAEGPLPEGLPAVLLPTTAGTGSEVSPAAVLRGADGGKRGLIDDALFASLALVDPDLTMDLPPGLTAATGIDAFAHAVGSYVSTTGNDLADALCRRAMELVESNLRAATFAGADRPAARVGMSMAATMAMYGRVNGGKSAIHAVAYGVQAMYDVPHATAIGLVMPAVLAYDAPAAVDELAALGTALYDARGPPRERAAAFVDGVRRLRDDLDLPGSLSAVGGEAGDLDDLAALAVESERHLRANPRPMTADDARDVLATLL
jgi:alcohol dehydrogenase class IV